MSGGPCPGCGGAGQGVRIPLPRRPDLAAARCTHARMYSLARDREPDRDLKVTLRFIWTLWNTGLTDGRDLACRSERDGCLLG